MLCRSCLFCMTLGLFLAHLEMEVAQGANSDGDSTYVVVSLVPDNHPLQQATDALTERHQAKRVDCNPTQLHTLLPSFRMLSPDYVAFVVSPDDLDINLVNRILDLAIQVDDDPFVDFAYGFITGRDGSAAVRLVEAASRGQEREARIAQLGVASAELPRSLKQDAAWPIGKKTLPVTAYTSRGDSDDSRDKVFIEQALQGLDGAPIILLASHGYPDGLVGGPKAVDLRGRRFAGSVVFNIACYTGVTRTWFEEDWSSLTVRQREVAAENSFCLKMIETGVGAYFAYVCPRPSGPTMMGDALVVAASGDSVGELWRQHLNSVVLAHLATGANRVVVRSVREGDALKVDRTPAEAVLKMSTGGILIGDPAYRPFAKLPDSDPRVCHVTQRGDEIKADIQITTPLFHFFASEPINYWNDREPALRLESNVPLGDRSVTQVRLVNANLGKVPHKLVAAVETHHNKRSLHIKAIFPQPDLARLQSLQLVGMKGSLEILTKPHEPAERPDVFRAGADN